ncbi:hypothetical protein WAZ07_04305 [Bacillus sp. FJAT-51639]|uniref:Uncharacterized protein n=1 Tax=Bacillus bruguierae TaxID=3127667 RepID=A0ABU8FCZ9_9BACI
MRKGTEKALFESKVVEMKLKNEINELHFRVKYERLIEQATRLNKAIERNDSTIKH